MLMTAILFRCLSPVLTVVAGLGSRPFRVARLPAEKEAIHRLYDRLGVRSLRSDHLFLNQFYREWKTAPRQFDTQLGPVRDQVSWMGLKRIDETRRLIYRELRDHLRLDRVAPTTAATPDYDANSHNEALVRFVLATGLYPDLALANAESRNSYALARVSGRIRPSTLSINHALAGATTPGDSSQNGNDGSGEGEGRRASLYLYEELTDLGFSKIVSRLTAIDPLILVLLAQDARVVGEGGLVCLDGWLHLEIPDAGDRRTLLALARHWNDFIQYAIYKRFGGGGGDQLDTCPHYESFEQALLGLLDQTDIHRPLVSARQHTE